MTPAPSLAFDPSELNQLCGLRVLESNPADFGGPDTPADFNAILNDPEALNEALADTILDIQAEMDELELKELEEKELEEDDEEENFDEEDDVETDDLPYEDCFTEAGDMYNDDRDE